MAGANLLMFGTRNMAMKYAIVLVCLLALQRVIPTVGQQSPDDILDEKERQVTSLQLQLQNSSENQCALLDSCNAAGSCSRSSCAPLVGDSNRTTCQKVKYNVLCPDQGTCPSKKFDYDRPYVRLAPTTDSQSAETAITVCTQRELSGVFKEICNSTSLSRAFFGAVDGTYSHFPGSDQNATDCGAYDPRVRPWYRASISVAKAVMVLLDVGPSMGKKIFLPLKGTYFTNAQSIIFELLNTFSEQDYVNIITFSSTTATSLAPIPGVIVKYTDLANSSYHPEFDDLKHKLSTVNLDINSQPSNISIGIAEAIRNYEAIGSSNFLQILVVITDGNAASLSDGALAALQGRNGTKIFIFKLPHSDDSADPFLPSGPFLTQLTNMGGSFHVIQSEALNRLYSIRAYFSFLASFQAQIKNSNRADYSGIYEDFERVVDQIFSITRPAFSNDGELLGVVGLNVFVNELPSNVRDALSRRNVSTIFDASKIVFTAKDAHIQNATIPDNPCPSNITPPPNTGLCPRTDFVSTINNLACCNACIVPPAASAKHTKVTPIAVGAGVGALALILTAITLFFLRRKRMLLFKNALTTPPPRISTYPPGGGANQNLHSAPNTPLAPVVPPRMN